MQYEWLITQVFKSGYIKKFVPISFAEPFGVREITSGEGFFAPLKRASPFAVRGQKIIHEFLNEIKPPGMK